ncbi:tautomerase family protein [Pseudonocardia spinosispora]|uniref:tautomerase family protein n=1 Tax=Pseudonocardia spinosispora TaxID=103441 RepID=UPI000411063B|nr:hypothetical protein [Pseudonocardia spinosispora]
MSMIDLTVSKGALSEAGKAELMSALTRTVLRCEGISPDNAVAESMIWTFVTESPMVMVGGKPADEPRYRVVVGLPQGRLDEEEKRGLVAELTGLVLRAERRERDRADSSARDSWRVWVIINEVAEGNWGGAGEIFRLADVLAFSGTPGGEVAHRLSRLN